MNKSKCAAATGERVLTEAEKKWVEESFKVCLEIAKAMGLPVKPAAPRDEGEGFAE